MEIPFILKNPQNWSALNSGFTELCKIIAALRDPENGCPWDLKQDFTSLQKYLVEETYEAISALRKNDYKEYCEELGDVLLQVLLNSQLAFDQQIFSLLDVMSTLKEKLIRRHPHVFKDLDKKIDSSEVEKQWQKIKQEEKSHVADILEEKIKKLDAIFPATLKASAIGEFSAQVNFDWENTMQTFKTLQDEVSELKAELLKADIDKEKIADEISDVYFTLAQVCRHLKFNPELIAESGNKKFISRFVKMHDFAAQNKKDFASLTKEELQNLWIMAKKSLRQKRNR